MNMKGIYMKRIPDELKIAKVKHSIYSCKTIEQVELIKKWIWRLSFAPNANIWNDFSIKVNLDKICIEMNNKLIGDK
jgi:hypothetical protein